jgi:hypothetical protein
MSLDAGLMREFQKMQKLPRHYATKGLAQMTLEYDRSIYNIQARRSGDVGSGAS